MSINELKNMSKIDFGKWCLTAKVKDIRAVLKEADIKGVSKFKKAEAFNVLVALIVDAEEAEVVEEIMYEEMLKHEGVSLNKRLEKEITCERYFILICDYNKARKCYLKLSKYFNPDKSTGNKEKFQTISKAWEYAKETYKRLEKVGDIDNPPF